MKYFSMTAAGCISAAFFVFTTSAFAQVSVEDRKIKSPLQSSNAQPVQSSGNAAEMYYQMQLLQQEVLQLRGLVEQQSFELKKLKQQRLDDYLDLDRRVSQLSKGGGASTASNNGAAATASRAPSTSSSASSSLGAAPNEMKRYREAMNLVLKEKRYDDAVVALKKHLDTFPDGRFSGNAKYWLGEVYLEKKVLEDSRQWFARVLSEHPKHNKVPDAQYKLGVVYHLMGDMASAKELLQKAAASKSNSAGLAQSYLRANFAQ
ncbi:MAG: tol-pal system protein YbgF [Agarilytica sp.]